MKQDIALLKRDHYKYDNHFGSDLRSDFPIFSRKIHGKKLVYLDNAATTQKPESVIEALSKYYKRFNANIHRGIHKLAEEATTAYEETRKAVANFINTDEKNIVFARNATESINLVVLGWASNHTTREDEILITEMEHHSNLVPWIMLSKKIGFKLRYIPVTDEGELNISNIDNLINEKTKLVSLTHVSNVLGTINPVKQITAAAHKVGAKVLIDAAQSIPHLKIDVKEIGCDFMAFSAHKMLGPTGVGVLYGKTEILQEMQPVYGGGEMIERVTYEDATYNEIPWRFEAGTQNIADVIAFKSALEYLQKINYEKARQHELKLIKHTMEGLNKLGFKILGPTESSERIGVISFMDDVAHPHDIATILDQHGVAIRAGHHCAQPLMRKFGVNATARASFYIYNDMDDVDTLLESLKEVRKYFE